jgi:hypothetical protein
VNAPKKRPSARRGRDQEPAPKPPIKITYKDIEKEFTANVLAEAKSVVLDEQDDDDDDDEAGYGYIPGPRRGSMLDRVLDHVAQKSVDFLRVGDKRGEELMDELHRELEMLQ